MRRGVSLLLLPLISAAGLHSAAASAAQAAPQAAVDMPAYQGRSLDSWLQDLRCDPCGPAFQPASDAIRAIGAAAVPYLVQEIERGPNATFAVMAIRVLGPVARSAVPELTAFYRREPSSFSPAMALVYLSAERPVIEALSSPTEQVRRNAILALGYGGSQVDAAAVPPLIKMLAKGSAQTRSDVLWALASIHKRDDLIVPALLRMMNDRDASVREEAVAALAFFDLARTRGRIIAALGDPDARVRGAAARSFGANVDGTTDDALVRPIIAALIVRLSDPVDDVRSYAAWALGAIGPRAKDAIVALTELTKDTNAQVSQTAIASLAAINDKTRYWRP